MPEWTWLRKYAARNAPPLTRGGLAKRVARDDALVRIVAHVGRVGMEVLCFGGEGDWWWVGGFDAD